MSNDITPGNRAARRALGRHRKVQRQATASIVATAAVAAETGRREAPASVGEPVEGVYRSRLDLASGRFAVIEGALGFQLVPWRADLDARLGRHVAGVMGENGRVEWSFARRPTLQI